MHDHFCMVSLMIPDHSMNIQAQIMHGIWWTIHSYIHCWHCKLKLFSKEEAACRLHIMQQLMYAVYGIKFPIVIVRDCIMQVCMCTNRHTWVYVNLYSGFVKLNNSIHHQKFKKLYIIALIQFVRNSCDPFSIALCPTAATILIWSLQSNTLQSILQDNYRAWGTGCKNTVVI